MSFHRDAAALADSNTGFAEAHRRTLERGAVAGQRKFTRIPKVNDLVHRGVPTEVIPTYCALADYSSNKTGLCWPKMETLAATLNRSVRTVQRHLHLLRTLGLIEFVERRRHKGRFSSYLYRVLHIVQTTGHGKPVGSRPSNIRRTKRVPTAPKSPKKDVKNGYWWLFGKEAPTSRSEEFYREEKKRKEEEAKRRTEGYEWLFR
jgi:Helix-turn-helix domain